MTQKVEWKVACMLAMGAVLTVSCSSGTERPAPATSTSASVVAHTAAASSTLAVPKETDAELKARSKVLSYDDLARYPDLHEGEAVTFRGKVVQVATGGGLTVYRVAVSPASYGYKITDVVWVNAPAEPKVLEEDLIQFWGIANGERSYTSIMGQQITLPEVDAAIVEIVRKRDGTVIVPTTPTPTTSGATKATPENCVGSAAEVKTLDEGFPALLQKLPGPIPIAGAGVDPLIGTGNGTGPGWSPAIKVECDGLPGRVTNLFIADNAYVASKRFGLTVTTQGMSQALSQTSLSSTKGFYTGFQGPDVLYVGIVPPSGTAPTAAMVVESADFKKRGGFSAVFPSLPQLPTGAARLVVIWAWRTPGGGYQRYVATRTIEIRQ